MSKITLIVCAQLIMAGCTSESPETREALGPDASTENKAIDQGPDADAGDGARGDASTERTELGSPDAGEETEESRSGLEGFCDHYVECGGTYYASAQACIDQSLRHWGECRRDTLDAFGTCMMDKVECEDWNPDVYNPRNTPCADAWDAVTTTPC